MAKTVEEILRESGLTDEQIKALDAKVTTGLTQVLSTAAQEREAAETARRAQAETYDKDIAPALDRWANEKAAYDTKVAAYEAALKAAKDGGFQIPDLLDKKTEPASGARGPDGKFVAGGNSVPGSPGYVDIKKDLTNELGGAFAFLADTSWKYRSLYGKELPDPPTQIIKEASERHLPPAVYAAQKYEFAKKEKEIQDAARKAEIDAAVKAAEDKKDKEWGEKMGSNPDLRRVEVSKFSEIHKAVKAGTRPDPIAPGMTEQQRDANTRAAIRKDNLATQTVQ
jgi:hypothetical protein